MTAESKERVLAAMRERTAAAVRARMEAVREERLAAKWDRAQTRFALVGKVGAK